MGRQKRLQKLKRRRKRGLPIREWSTDALQENQPPVVVYLREYTISFEPIYGDEGKTERLRRHIGEERVEQLHTMSLSAPKSAIPELIGLVEQFPDIPILYNWLGTCYGRLGDMEKYEQVVLQNYQRSPEYLFARVSYASVLLSRGETEKAAEVFGNVWDLNALYPHRKEYHVSEFLAFAAVVVQYMMRTRNLEAAENMYQTMLDIAPDHNITLQVKRIMEGSILLKAARRFLSFTSRLRPED